MNFKWLTVPWSNRVKHVQSVEMWEVRWESRHSEYAMGTSPELECFVSKELAEEFAVALRNAFKLLRHTSGTGVSVQRAGSR